MSYTPDFRTLIEIASPQPQRVGLLREYLEQQHYELLAEDQRLQYLYKLYGEKAVPGRWAELQARTPAEIVNAIQSSPGDDIGMKIINYIASFDPTLNHQYSQWLVIRWLKNGYQFEDLPSARQYLEVFTNVKRNLAQKDINKYPNLGDLYAAIAPYMTGQVVAVSKKDEKRELADRMSKPPETNVIYDDDQIKIVHPLTQEASCYWGQNTRWCTAATGSTNYFHTYNSAAPLYIILIKAENRRYQFQIVPKRDRYSYDESSFMDENDRPIDLKAFLKKYPVVFQALGERTFMPVMKKIGLEFFSKEATKAMDAIEMQDSIHSMDDLKKTDPSTWEFMNLQKLGNLVRNKSDLKVFPEKILRDAEFQRGLVQPVHDNDRRGESRARLITYLPEDYYENHLDGLLTWIYDLIFVLPEHLVTNARKKLLLRASPRAFARFPDSWRSVSLAHLTAETLASHSNQYAGILDVIPEAWRDEYVMDRYWESRILADQKLHLSEVPRRYWNEDSILRTLSNHPADMKNHVDVLNDEIIRLLAAQKKYEDNFIKEVPAQFRTEALFNRLVEYDKSHVKTFTYKNGYLNDRRRNVYILFPQNLWDAETALAGIGHDKELNFGDFPEKVQKSPEVVSSFLVTHPDRVDQVPASSITEDSLYKLMTEYDYKKDVPKILSALAARGTISGEDILKLADKQMKTYQDFFPKIPKSLRTDRVVAKFAELGKVPVAALTKPLQTEEIIASRLKENPKEFADVPAKFRTPEFALSMAKVNLKVISAVPTELLSEPLLWQMLRNKGDEEGFKYHRYSPYSESDHAVAKENFGRFPRELWSKRTVAIAIDNGLLPPDTEFYGEYHTSAVVAAILRCDYKKYKDFPKEVLTEKVLIKVAEVEPLIVLQLDPSEITEGIAYAAIEGGGRHWRRPEDNSRYSYERRQWDESDNKKAWEHIPRSVFSKRIYMSAVGRLIDLKDVPAKFRDDEMRKKAVAYHPRNILAIKNPAAFLNKYFKDADRSKRNETWLNRLEKAGFIWTRSGWFDVRTLPKETLPTGYKIAVQAAKTNRRIYMFSPQDKFLMYFYTLKSKVHFPYTLTPAQVAKYQKSIVEIVRLHFMDEDIGELNDKAGVYKIHGNVLSSSQLPKKKIGALQYTSVPHNGEERYEFFAQGKPILILGTSTSSGGWGNRGGKVSNTVWEIIDYPKTLANAKSIGEFLSKKSNLHHWEFDDIGILVGKRSESYEGVLADQKVGRVGDLVVYRANMSPERISVYDLKTKKMVGMAKVTKDGKDIYDVSSGYRSFPEGSITNLLRKAAQYLHQTKNIAGDLEFDKDTVADYVPDED